MKNFLLGTVALLAMGASASAADLAARPYTKAPAYAAAPIYNWTGFYIGGHVGGAFAGNNAITGTDSSDGRFLGGIQGGYDYQFAPNWVLGIEANYSWTGSSNNNGVVNGYTYSSDLKGLGSVTGRLGYTWGPALLYVKGGYAYADLNQSVVGPVGAAPVVLDVKKNGYTVGAGLEYLFTQNWSGKIEYQYYDFGNTTVVSGLGGFGLNGTSYKNDEHTVKAGLNYRFNWGGPVVAKY